MYACACLYVRVELGQGNKYMDTCARACTNECLPGQTHMRVCVCVHGHLFVCVCVCVYVSTCALEYFRLVGLPRIGGTQPVSSSENFCLGSRSVLYGLVCVSACSGVVSTT